MSYTKGATRMGTHALLIFAITSLVTNVVLPFFIDPTYDSHPAAGLPPSQNHGIHEDDASSIRKWLQHLIIPGFTLRRGVDVLAYPLCGINVLDTRCPNDRGCHSIDWPHWNNLGPDTLGSVGNNQC